MTTFSRKANFVSCRLTCFVFVFVFFFLLMELVAVWSVPCHGVEVYLSLVAMTVHKDGVWTMELLRACVK